MRNGSGRASGQAIVAGVAALVILSAALLAREPFGHGASPPAPAAPVAPPPAPAATPSPDPGEGLAIGLTEMNAALLSEPLAQPLPPPGFSPWRDHVAGLRPRYLRLMIDWAVLQPDPGQPPNWARPVDGCSRGLPPCVGHSGVRDALRAIAGQQLARPDVEVLVSIYGVPDWAAAPPGGCERADVAPRSRPIADTALPAYRALIRSLSEVAAAEGAALRWWSPWNEPNGPYFVSPQRGACDRASPLVSPAVYTRLAQSMIAELAALPGDERLVVGELAGLSGPLMRGGGVEEFFAALPDDVVCSAAVFAQHAYASRVDAGAATAPVAQLKAALAARPCAAHQPIWITETGVGGPDTGGERTGGEEELKADCRALDAALRRWDVDPRVQVAFQYTFRDDPAYPVGLADATLSRLWPAYELWKAWGGDRPPAGPAPRLPDACAAAR